MLLEHMKIQNKKLSFFGQFVLVLLSWLLFIPSLQALPESIGIGGLFDSPDHMQKSAFRFAVDRVNNEWHLHRNTRLSAHVEDIRPNDAFYATKKVCHLLRSGVAAIFGPQSAVTSTHVQSMCDAMDIPHIETRWDYRLRREDNLINLYPHPNTLSKAYADLVREWKWKAFTILYEDNEGLVRLQELLKASTPSEFKITVRQLPQTNDYGPLLKELKFRSENYIVLDCATEKIFDILKQAKDIDMMTTYHNYLITSLDIHTVNLEPFRYEGTNITGFRMVDPDKEEVKHAIQGWESNPDDHIHGEGPIEFPGNTMKVETALMYDAVYHFAKTLSELDNNGQHIEIKSLNCDASDSWQYGRRLIHNMKMVEVEGLTGLVRFDMFGFRTNFNLDIVKLENNGLQKIGTWTFEDGVYFIQTASDVSVRIGETLQNKTLKVVSLVASPYLHLVEGHEELTGNDKYEGFVVDLIAIIAEMRGFNFTFYSSKKHGSYDASTGTWNGMIRELLEHRADLAIGDLTINYQREQAVDFTTPFMNLGISILYRKEQKKPPNLFSFLSPFSIDVWIYMATAYMGVSILLFILARISPYEWESPHPCNQEPDELENQLNFLNCLWFSIGSLMAQGCDILPKAVSTRMVAGIWWFFTLIMIASYTANLASFLTLDKMGATIKSAEDLAKQMKIKYGVLGGGTTWAFFRDSPNPTYKRMASFMEATRPTVFTSSNREGRERVQKGGYAFFMESAGIEYEVERDCNLYQIGGLLDNKGYGIALPPGSPFTGVISGSILQLQESRQLKVLKDKWWKRKGEEQCKTEDAKAAGSENELGLDSVGGVFVVLIGGMVSACFLAVCEFVWKSRKMAIEEKASLWSEMGKEIKQILLCKSANKPVKKDNASQQEKEVSTTNHFAPAYTQYGFVREPNL